MIIKTLLKNKSLRKLGTKLIKTSPIKLLVKNPRQILKIYTVLSTIWTIKKYFGYTILWLFSLLGMYEFYTNDKYWAIVDSIYFKLFSSLALLIEAIRTGVSENTSAIIKAVPALVPVFDEPEASPWSNFSIWAWLGGIIIMLIFGLALNICINSDDKPGSSSSNIDFSINNNKIGETTTDNIYNKSKDLWNYLCNKANDFWNGSNNNILNKGKSPEILTSKTDREKLTFIDNALDDLKLINKESKENINKLNEDNSSSSGSTLFASTDLSVRNKYIEAQRKDILDNLNQVNTKNHLDLVELYNKALEALNNNNTSKFEKLKDEIHDLKKTIWNKIKEETTQDDSISNASNSTIRPAERLNTVFNNLSNKLKPEETPVSANTDNSGYTSNYSDVHSEPPEIDDFRPYSPVLENPIVETPSTIQSQGELALKLMNEKAKELDNRPYIKSDDYPIHSILEDSLNFALISQTLYIILLLILLISSIILYIDAKFDWKELGIIPVHDW
jgi:hypothetical protein